MLSASAMNVKDLTKNYVDNLVTGLKTRIITRVATTANVDLSNDLQNGDTLPDVPTLVVESSEQQLPLNFITSL